MPLNIAEWCQFFTELNVLHSIDPKFGCTKIGVVRVQTQKGHQCGVTLYFFRDEFTLLNNTDY